MFGSVDVAFLFCFGCLFGFCLVLGFSFVFGFDFDVRGDFDLVFVFRGGFALEIDVAVALGANLIFVFVGFFDLGVDFFVVDFGLGDFFAFGIDFVFDLGLEAAALNLGADFGCVVVSLVS